MTSSPADAANGAIVTGFAAESGTPVSAPEPSSLLLLGAGSRLGGATQEDGGIRCLSNRLTKDMKKHGSLIFHAFLF